MSVFTLFAGQNITAYRDDVDDPTVSRDAVSFQTSQLQNVLFHTKRELALDHAATFTLDLAGAASTQWEFVLFKVIGSARLDTTGTDFDGVTAITGKLPLTGTSVYPGIGCISTYNVSSIVVESLADGTVVEVFFGVLCADSDSRLTTLA